MRPTGLALAEQAVQQDLRAVEGSSRPPEDCRDVHCPVVRHHRQLVSEDAVAAPKHEIADELMRIELLMAEDLVVEGEGPCGTLRRRTADGCAADRRAAPGQARARCRIARTLVAVWSAGGGIWRVNKTS